MRGRGQTGSSFFIAYLIVQKVAEHDHRRRHRTLRRQLLLQSLLAEDHVRHPLRLRPVVPHFHRRVLTAVVLVNTVALALRGRVEISGALRILPIHMVGAERQLVGPARVGFS